MKTKLLFLSVVLFSNSLLAANSIVVTTLTDEPYNGDESFDAVGAIVTTGSESGDKLSLREAIGIINKSDLGEDVTITFSGDLAGGKILLGDTTGDGFIDDVTVGEFVVSRSMLINGDINGGFVQDITIDGGHNSSVFRITNGKSALLNVELKSLNINNGYSSENGGNIYNVENLNIINCEINGGTLDAAKKGAGIYHSTGVLILANSSVHDNEIQVDGSSTGATATGGGVCVYSGTAKIYNSSIYSNKVKNMNAAAGLYLRGGSDVQLYSSIIAGNQIYINDQGEATVNGANDILGNGLLTLESSLISDEIEFSSSDNRVDLGNNFYLLDGKGVDYSMQNFVPENLNHSGINSGKLYQGFIYSKDANGNPRSDGNGVDIGAYEKIDNAVNASQVISLKQGTNLVSTNHTPFNPDLVAVLQSIGSDVSLVKNSDGKSLRKIGANWANNIGDWECNQGYLIKATQDVQFLSIGFKPDGNTPIGLKQGYNFYPFNKDLSETVSNEFTGYDVSFVKDSGGLVLNEEDMLEPGKTYLVKVN